MIGLLYGDLDLQADGITVTETDVYNMPDNGIQAEKLAEADGAVIVKQQYQPKQFMIRGSLRADTISDLEDLRDTFVTGISKKNQPFDIDYASGVRRYLATYKSMVMSRSPTTMGFTVDFLCPDGVGWDVDSSALLAPTSTTNSTAAMAITVGGSYMAEPLITVTVTAVSGGTSKTITIGNGTTLRSISVTRTWIAGDVMEIDSYKKTLYVNNAVVDFSGQFPSWDPGVGELSYLDDFTTSRNVSVRADYTRRWL